MEKSVMAQRRALEAERVVEEALHCAKEAQATADQATRLVARLAELRQRYDNEELALETTSICSQMSSQTVSRFRGRSQAQMLRSPLPSADPAVEPNGATVVASKYRYVTLSAPQRRGDKEGPCTFTDSCKLSGGKLRPGDAKLTMSMSKF